MVWLAVLACFGGVGAARSAAATAAATAAVPAAYLPLPPSRAYDSRAAALDQSQPGPIAAGRVVTVNLSGAGVPAGAAGVALTVTAIDPTGPGNLRVYPAGESTLPTSSTVNFLPGSAVADSAAVGVGTGATPAVAVAVAGSATQFTVDVTGYYPAGDGFTALTPTRILDTRTGAGGVSGALQPGQVYSVLLGSAVPAGARAVVLTATAITPPGAGNLRVYPDSSGNGATPAPMTSVVNYQPGADVADLIVVSVPADRRIDLASFGSPANAALDLSGYLTSGYTPVAPTRILDTRTGTGGIDGALQPAAAPGSPGPYLLAVGGSGPVPVTAAAVVVTVTAVDPAGPGNLRIFPDGYGYGLSSGQPAPNVVTVNYVPGQASADLALVEVPADGYLDLETFGSATDVTVDVVGYVPTGAASVPAATMSTDENAVAQMGYTVLSAVAPEAQFAPLIAIPADASADSSGYVQHVFFFAGTTFLGTDTAMSSPSATVSVADTTGALVTLVYTVYNPGDSLCCTTAQPGVAVVRFTDSGGKLVALDPIPPANSSTAPSRR